MSEKETGGPAFPGTQYAGGIKPTGHSEGMTIRDWFAGMALQGWITAQPTIKGVTLNAGDDHAALIASAAYAWADAMLKERSK